MKKEIIIIRVDKETKELLQQTANKNKMSMSEFIRSIMLSACKED